MPHSICNVLTMFVMLDGDVVDSNWYLLLVRISINFRIFDTVTSVGRQAEGARTVHQLP